MGNKVALITWAQSKNYGTCLQAYAAQQLLKKMGFHCDLLNFFVPRKYWFLNIPRVLIKNNYIYLRYKGYNKNYIHFFRDHLSFYSIIWPSDYNAIENRYSAFITGSDQIWNPNYLNTFYMLDFVKSRPCFSYSTSIGVAELPKDKVPTYKNYLNKFQCFGMREQAGVNIITSLFPDKRVEKVLDPTLLMTADEWKKLSDYARIEFKLPEHYVFCYLIGKRDEYKNQLNKVWLDSGIKDLIIVKSAENGSFSLSGAYNYNNCGPIEFVYLLSNSDLVCTDSFHATALSINMSKNFIEFMRFDDGDIDSQNSRIYEILQHYGLSDRIFNFDKKFYNIDYSNIQVQLNMDRRESENFLKDALNIY